jgi:manganese transport protein
MAGTGGLGWHNVQLRSHHLPLPISADWKSLVRGLSPLWHPSKHQSGLLYGYFAVGIFSAMLMVYEVHFYSSGAIEEDWKPKYLRENFVIASLGSFLGSILTVGMMALGAILFLPRGIFPQQLSTVIIAGSYPFAQKGLVLAVLGSLACIGGAAVETALSTGYNVCQFFDWDWGKNMPAKSAPVYTATWMGILLLALVVAISGVRPLQLVNISIIFGMAIMPLTYYPILRAAADKKLMGQHVNTRGVTAVGMFFLLVIVIAAIAAFPLMILTHSGRP